MAIWRKGVSHMPNKVFLEDGSQVSIHTRIKDMCQAAKDQLGYSHQDIADRICKRFGIESFSVNTVSNFFSERSKASTIYTTGYICAVLDISIDAVFCIESGISELEEADFLRQVRDLKTDLRIKEEQLSNLEQRLEEKDLRLAEAHEAINHYRKESELNISKVQPWVFKTVLIMFICTLVLIAAYLVIFDINNPDYGLFKAALNTIESFLSISA